ncbi:hypothetical protein ABPG73_011079 [Tetrahymena malaccensis]
MELQKFNQQQLKFQQNIQLRKLFFFQIEQLDLQHIKMIQGNLSLFFTSLILMVQMKKLNIEVIQLFFQLFKKKNDRQQFLFLKNLNKINNHFYILYIDYILFFLKKGMKMKFYHNIFKIEVLKNQFLLIVYNHRVEFKNQYYLILGMLHLLNQHDKELKNLQNHQIKQVLQRKIPQLDHVQLQLVSNVMNHLQRKDYLGVLTLNESLLLMQHLINQLPYQNINSLQQFFYDQLYIHIFLIYVYVNHLNMQITF